VPKQLTILRAMVIVAIIAIDFGAVRAFFTEQSLPHVVAVLILGALPMTNALVVVYLISGRRRSYSPFLSGVKAAGAVALMISIASICWSSEAVERLTSPLVQPLVDDLRRRPHPSWWDIAIIYLLDAALFTLPQLAFALLGGYLLRRRVVLRARRVKATGSPRDAVDPARRDSRAD
jgi:hypothetical protein